MHIPDGVLSPQVCAVTGAVAAGAVGYSLYRLRDSLAGRTVPMTGMMAAVIFAGQMVNFPLGAVPASGHLIGGVLAAIVLGPWAGCLALTLVLLVQRFLFSDGGMLALGANVLHMAVIGAIGGYAVYAAVRRLCGGGHRGTVFAAAVASWLSVMAAAALFCLEFRLSPAAAGFDFGRVFALMTGFHALIGVGEALITAAIVSFVLAQRPELIHAPASPGLAAGFGRVLTAGLVTALAVGAFIAPFASEVDDGLETVAAMVGFDTLEIERPGLFADYDDVIEGREAVSKSLAGISGTLAVFLLALGSGWVWTRRSPPACNQDS